MAGLSLGIGTTVSNDIFRNILNINSERKVLWLNRLTVLTATAGGVIAALHYYDSMVLKWNYLSMATRGITIFIPLTCLIMLHGHFAHNHRELFHSLEGIISKAGLPSMIAAIAAAFLWKIIFPESRNLLFPGLAACAAVMISAVIYGLNRKKKQ